MTISQNCGIDLLCKYV